MKEMTIKDVQAVSLEILQDIHDFCEKNKIFYTLCGGSLIGAIRHNGFIPWDDDMDIAMPRPDYDRFIRTYRSKNGYRLFSREIEGGEDVYIAYSRVCDMEKTYVDSSLTPWCKCETGLWIDIMPLDGAYSNEKLEEKRWRRAKTIFHKNGIARSSIVGISRVFDVANKCNMSMGPKWLSKNKIIKIMYWGVKIIFAKMLFKGDFSNCDKLIKICKECDYNNSFFYTDIAVTHYGMREYNPKTFLDSRFLHQFEDTQFYVLCGYDGWLSHIYGDYMKLPPESERKYSHEANTYYWK